MQDRSLKIWGQLSIMMFLSFENWKAIKLKFSILSSQRLPDEDLLEPKYHEHFSFI